jgi:mRNA interferase RelE/StbE
MYSVILKKKAVKALRKIPNNYLILINNHLHELEENPRPFGYKKLSDTDEKYRIRVGVYRIVYKIKDDVLIIEVIDIGHRSDIYDN